MQTDIHNMGYVCACAVCTQAFLTENILANGYSGMCICCDYNVGEFTQQTTSSHVCKFVQERDYAGFCLTNFFLLNKIHQHACMRIPLTMCAEQIFSGFSPLQPCVVGLCPSSVTCESRFPGLKGHIYCNFLDSRHQARRAIAHSNCNGQRAMPSLWRGARNSARPSC